MNKEIMEKAIDLAASYYANWKYSEASLEYDDARKYADKYEGAACMAALIGIKESEIKEHAWHKWGDEIGKAYEANNVTI